LVQFVLAKIATQDYNRVANNDPGAVLHGEHTSISSLNGIDGSLANALKGIAQEGDIILPLDVRVLRKGEPFKQWVARAKQSSIETTRRAAGGSFARQRSGWD
jgi:hypothetical protein